MQNHTRIGTYITGFGLSIGLTLAAYFLVANHALSRGGLMAAIAVLALVQFLVQAVFFLHVGREAKPRWKLLVMVLMVLIVTILVGGSLWIMNNLNYHMTPTQINHYLQDQDGI